jgi:hypothetical protein
MKKLILLLLLVALPSLAALRTNVTLVFDYPVNELSTNLTFKFYSSTNAAAPLASWTLFAAVPATNTTYTFPLQPQQRFFFVTASNYWAESDPSSVASTPVPPRSGVLSIQ